MGTLGGGNHYAEIQVIDKVFDDVAARKMGIDQEGQVLRMPCSFPAASHVSCATSHACMHARVLPGRTTLGCMVSAFRSPKRNIHA